MPQTVAFTVVYKFVAKKEILLLATDSTLVTWLKYQLTILQWEVKAPMPSVCFRSICKQMAKLHEAITELLPQCQIKVSL